MRLFRSTCNFKLKLITVTVYKIKICLSFFLPAVVNTWLWKARVNTEQGSNTEDQRLMSWCLVKELHDDCSSNSTMAQPWQKPAAVALVRSCFLFLLWVFWGMFLWDYRTKLCKLVDFWHCIKTSWQRHGNIWKSWADKAPVHLLMCHSITTTLA